MNWGVSLQHDAIVLLLAFVALAFLGTVLESHHDR